MNAGTLREFALHNRPAGDKGSDFLLEDTNVSVSSSYLSDSHRQQDWATRPRGRQVEPRVESEFALG